MYLVFPYYRRFFINLYITQNLNSGLIYTLTILQHCQRLRFSIVLSPPSTRHPRLVAAAQQEGWDEPILSILKHILHILHSIFEKYLICKICYIECLYQILIHVCFLLFQLNKHLFPFFTPRAKIQGAEGVCELFIVVITTMKSSHTPSAPCT